MKRKDFLKRLGMGALVLPRQNPILYDDETALIDRADQHRIPNSEFRVPNSEFRIPNSELPQGVDCVLIPQETAGPYPLDLSEDPSKFRVDITEGLPGMQLDLNLTIVNVNNGCAPIPNARVDIWHTDKDGRYSGYNQPGANTVGQTFMRGIQVTDANGLVHFKTIYPGWYEGRITHIHFEVFLNSVSKAVSQMAFPESITQTVYNTPLYAPKGQNTSVANNQSDNVFASPANGLQYQLLSIISNAATGGYNGVMVIGINAPLTGIQELEPETGGQFILKQNYPNPFTESTTLEFWLKSASYVRVLVFDSSAKLLGVVFEGSMPEGTHTLPFNKSAFGKPLSKGTYVYQIVVTNAMGRFSQVKAMTVL